MDRVRHPDIDAPRQGDWYVGYFAGRGWVAGIRASSFHQTERSFRSEDDALEWVEEHIVPGERVRIMVPSRPEVILTKWSDCPKCAELMRKYGAPDRRCDRCWKEDNPGGQRFKLELLDVNPDIVEMLFGGPVHG